MNNSFKSSYNVLSHGPGEFVCVCDVIDRKQKS